jgi:hypothetical protein
LPRPKFDFREAFIIQLPKKSMREILKFVFGLNGASIIRGFRLGPHESIRAAHASLSAAYPFEERESAHLRKIRDLRDLIPSASLVDILDSILQEKKGTLRLELIRHEDGILPIHEAVAILGILVAENPKEVLEIGTYMGHTTKAMAENLPNASIHTVDLPPDFSTQQDPSGGPPKDDFHLIARRVVGREFKGQAVGQRIKQHFGDTAIMDFREFGRPTFFFIDGSHTYEYCKQDSEKCFALCDGAGTFLWHDFDEGHPGVVKFIGEWRALGRDIMRIQGTAIAYWKSA